MLKVENLTKVFGGLVAVDGVSLEVTDSEILGLIGPNGAGKSTLINLISAFYPVTSGKVLFGGRDITRLKAHQVAALGIGRTFQASTLFMELIVLDNVFTGYHMSYRTNIFGRVLRIPSALREEETLKQRTVEILEFMGLGSLRNELAKNLPHGNQRILGVCMALAINPKLLLLDEPLTGMNPIEIQTMVNLIRQIRHRGITIVLIEHNVSAIMDLCDRIIVLNYGKKLAEGSPKEIQENEEVIDAYLGKA